MQMLYFHCNFQQDIAVFCAISDCVLLLLFADASCQGQREFPFWSQKFPPPLSVKIPENSRYENTAYTSSV